MKLFSHKGVAMSLHGCASGLLFTVFMSIAGLAIAQDIETQKKEAETAYQSGDFQKCIDLTTKVLSTNPKDHVALYLRASAHVELGVVRRDGKELRAGIEDARESLRSGG